MVPVVVKADGLTYIPCVSMRHVADPTAAGDSFVGALAVGVTLGLSHAQALEFACLYRSFDRLSDGRHALPAHTGRGSDPNAGTGLSGSRRLDVLKA